MGANGDGVTAAVLNRPGSLGPAAGKRSRGDLPLMALTHATIAEATDAITARHSGEWRGFNLVVADRTGAMFIKGTGQGRPLAQRLPPGVSMITAHDPNDLDSPRVARHLRRFQEAAPPDPDNWAAWREILSDRTGPADEQINVPPRGGFGTICSSMLAIPARGDLVWWFSAGAPHETPFVRVTPDPLTPAGSIAFPP